MAATLGHGCNALHAHCSRDVPRLHTPSLAAMCSCANNQASFTHAAIAADKRPTVTAASICGHHRRRLLSKRRSVVARDATKLSPDIATVSAPGFATQVNTVYKFGGSSVRDATRMKEVANIICSFPNYLPCVVLSAMGKTTNMLLSCGELALTSHPEDIGKLAPLRAIRELHQSVCKELKITEAVRHDVSALLSELQQLLVGISIMQDLTLRARDSLVSFGERLSTRIFAAYLQKLGLAARQFDSWEIGFTSSDDFTNAEIIYDATLSKVKAAFAVLREREIPVVTGFLARGRMTGAITTLGRGGSDLTATVIGAALELKEVQVWKDVDGVLSAAPSIVQSPVPVCSLTFDEATELAYFGAQVLHPLAMQPALRFSSMAVRVKNSYNACAEGTLIRSERDMSDVLVTSIVLKDPVTLVDLVSSRMLGQWGFLATVFDVFRRNHVSVDVVASSEVSISLTLDPKKIWQDNEEDEQLNKLMYDLDKIANVTCTQNFAIVSLICNVKRTNEIMQRAFMVMHRDNIHVRMMSQGASKVNISLVIDGNEGRKAVNALHTEFFGNIDYQPSCPVNGH